MCIIFFSNFDGSPYLGRILFTGEIITWQLVSIFAVNQRIGNLLFLKKNSNFTSRIFFNVKCGMQAFNHKIIIWTRWHTWLWMSNSETHVSCIFQVSFFRLKNELWNGTLQHVENVLQPFWVKIFTKHLSDSDLKVKKTPYLHNTPKC